MTTNTNMNVSPFVRLLGAACRLAFQVQCRRALSNPQRHPGVPSAFSSDAALQAMITRTLRTTSTVPQKEEKPPILARAPLVAKPGFSQVSLAERTWGVAQGRIAQMALARSRQ